MIHTTRSSDSQKQNETEYYLSINNIDSDLYPLDQSKENQKESNSRGLTILILETTMNRKISLTKNTKEYALMSYKCKNAQCKSEPWKFQGYCCYEMQNRENEILLKYSLTSSPCLLSEKQYNKIKEEEYKSGAGFLEFTITLERGLDNKIREIKTIKSNLPECDSRSSATQSSRSGKEQKIFIPIFIGVVVLLVVVVILLVKFFGKTEVKEANSEKAANIEVAAMIDNKEIINA
jgi:hypothetical protein